MDDEVGKAGYTWRQIEKLAQNRVRWIAASTELYFTGRERIKSSW